MTRHYDDVVRLSTPLSLLLLHPFVVVGLIPPADEVGHQDDDDHGGEDTAHYDGDQVIGTLAIRGTVTGGLNKNLYQISDETNNFMTPHLEGAR